MVFTDLEAASDISNEQGSFTVTHFDQPTQIEDVTMTDVDDVGYQQSLQCNGDPHLQAKATTVCATDTEGKAADIVDLTVHQVRLVTCHHKKIVRTVKIVQIWIAWHRKLLITLNRN